jgi:hypothetical protein
VEDDEVAEPRAARVTDTVRVMPVARPPGRRGVALALALALSVLAAMALPVLASTSFITDPNDTPGLLDVRDVRLRDLEGTPPSWTVTTFNDWTPRSLWDRGYLLLNLDTLGTPDVDYYVLVHSDRERLRGSMWRDRVDARDVRLFRVAVRRRGGNSLRISVQLGRLTIGVNREAYRWSVTSLFTSGVCRRTCVDRAPDAMMVEEPTPRLS